MADISYSSLSLSARRYAGALFAAAAQAGCVEGVAENMKALAAALAKSADFRLFVASPLYDAAAQTRFIRAFSQAAGLGAVKAPARGKAGAAVKAAGKAGAAVKADAGSLTAHCLAVLAQRGRLRLLPQVIAAFAAPAAKARGEVEIDVVSAEELSPKQEGQLLGFLSALAKENAHFAKYLAGKNKILHKRTDSALLGGFIVRCGSLLIDASLRSKLHSLKLALKEVG